MCSKYLIISIVFPSSQLSLASFNMKVELFSGGNLHQTASPTPFQHIIGAVPASLDHILDEPYKDSGGLVRITEDMVIGVLDRLKYC
jgi:hypothetical protein